jgi:hypothetical protein
LIAESAAAQEGEHTRPLPRFLSDSTARNGLLHLAQTAGTRLRHSGLNTRFITQTFHAAAAIEILPAPRGFAQEKLTMSTVFAYIAGRLTEPSTHAALAAMAVASIPLFGNYGAIAAAIFGVLGITVKEARS